MKVGLQINTFTWPGGPEAIGPTLARVVRDADELGFDSIWVMDHFFQIRGGGPPEAPMLEGQTALGFLAAHTERARLGLMVGGVHYRAPGLWIKATTTLDVLSGGRLEVGLGAGWLVEEFDVLGAPFAVRGEVLDEHIATFRACWTEDRPSFAGTHTSFPPLRFEPRPVRPGGPPLTIGGFGPAALRRAAGVDGWQPVNLTPEELVEPVAELRRLRAEAGRASPPEVLLRCVAEVDDAATPDPDRPLVGPPDAVVAGIHRYAEVGVTALLVAPALGQPVGANLATMQRLAAEVFPKLGAPVSRSGAGTSA